MSTSKPLRFSVVNIWLASLFGSGFAQRPANASVCDYYAQAKYGANNSDTQLKFIQHLVALSFEGGSKLPDVSSEITGILRPGSFDGVDVDLRQFFNGSRASTNVNNAPIGIDWLDQGGTTPLADFLAGGSDYLVLANSSNQYQLFGKFFIDFSRVFGCTLPPAPLPNTSGPVSLAYAHKFMDLDYNQLSYFINQVALAASYYGVSAQDADTFRTQLNSRYNVRCAPAVTLNPTSGPQLLSLCQNPTCPLAVPVSNCAAYVDLLPNGNSTGDPSTVTATATATAIGTSGSSTSVPKPANSGKLSTGGIAGVAIGAAAVVLFAVIALVYFVRQRRRASVSASAQAATMPSWAQQQLMYPKDPHSSYHSTGQPPSEMDVSRYQSPREQSTQIPSPDPTGLRHQSYSAPPVEIGSSVLGGREAVPNRGTDEVQPYRSL